MSAKIKDYVVCVLCGRFHLSGRSALPATINEHHELQGKLQRLGGDRDISWNSRDLTDEELLALRDVIETIRSRIEDETSKRGIG